MGLPAIHWSRFVLRTRHAVVWLILVRLYAVAAVPIADAAPGPQDQEASVDVVVYGGTSGGVMAAVQVRRMGGTVAFIVPEGHVGGLTTSGLGWTDSGDKSVIGGLALEFYQRIKQHYDAPEAWRFQTAESYARYRPEESSMWTFEPHVAQKQIDVMLAEQKIVPILGERLDRIQGVRERDLRIVELEMESGRRFQGRRFIDATYEGDLMAAAGVSYMIGRESNSEFSETLNGNQPSKNVSAHRFLKAVDPFVIAGDSASGLLPGIDNRGTGVSGEADRGLQAYCFRMCLSRIAENRIPFTQPEGYDESRYELLFRNFEAGDLRLPLKMDLMPNGKTDTNNFGAVSIDNIGGNDTYPEADYAERAEIIAAHRVYQQGLMWTLAHHPRTPLAIREQMADWGLAADEFPESDHWPPLIYVREARRMRSDYVLSEQDCRRERLADDPVGIGSYNMDSHNVRRYVDREGFVQNEGDIQVSPGGPYLISYRSIIPARGEVENLLVPVCLSATHIAYGSIRMEPVFMILGQSAGTAAMLSLQDDVAMQAVNREKLLGRLRADRQVLDLPK